MLKYLVIIFLLIPLKVFSKDQKSPFVFLNQFFEYDVTQKYQVAGMEIPKNKFISINNLKLEVQKQAWLKGNWAIVVRDQNNRAVFTLKKHNFSENQVIDLPLNILKNEKIVLSQICFSKMNFFSKITLCQGLDKTLNQTNQSIPEVYIDGKKTESFGRVVLNDLTKNIRFTLKMSRFDYFTLETRQRRIVPAAIQKESDALNYKVTFLDLQQKACIWDTQIQNGQDNFQILCDSLITTYQDFVNNDKSTTSYSVTYYKPPPIKPSDDFDTITPFLGSSQLQGNTSNKNVSIITHNDLGLHLLSVRKMTKYTLLKPISNVFPSAGINLNLRNLQYEDSLNNVAISNTKLMLYGVKVYLYKPLSEDLTLSAVLSLAQETSLDYISTSSQITVSEVLNKSIGAHIKFNIYDKNNLKAFMQSGYDVLLPSTLSGESSKMGSLISAGVALRYSKGVNTYGLGVDYSLREQETKLQKIRNQTFDYMAIYSIAY